MLPATLVAMTVAAIVLAAGASRRLGQPKQLLMLEGETMLDRAIRLANESGADPVIAVLGAHDKLIREAVLTSNAALVVNSAWERGISTSIRAGLTTVEERAPRSAGVLILGCDQPLLTAGHLHDLLDLFGGQGETAIAASAYAGILGVPAAFPREAFAELFALSGDQGARALLMKPPCPLIALPFRGGEIDIDLPADMVHLE